MTALRRAGLALACALLLTGTAACGSSGDGSGGHDASSNSARDSDSDAADAGQTADGDGDADDDGDGDGDGDSLGSAADQSLCTTSATAITAPYGDGFPTSWGFPPHSVVYNYEDREATGAIVTAVSSASFSAILDYLNKTEPVKGYQITDGETEENDAEANWTATGYTGRWAIRKSATCDGETVIQVLAAPVG